MKEKQFDHIEDRFREAANEYEQPFDEQSWSRMEQLLDKDDRKPRPFLWIIPALMVLMLGGFFLYRSYHKEDQKSLVTQSNSEVKAPTQSSDLVVNTKPGEINPVSEETKTNTITNNNTVEINKPADAKSAAAPVEERSNSDADKKEKKVWKRKSNSDFALTTQTPDLTTDDPRPNKNSRRSIAKSGTTISTSHTEDQLSEAEDQKGSTNTTVIKESVMPEQKTTAADITETIAKTDNEIQKEELKEKIPGTLKDSTVKKPEEKNVAKKTTEEDKKKKNKGFYVLLAGGADFSSVKLFSFKDNPVVPRFGAGVGYSLNDRWSLQTGFYMSSKKYIAGPKDYKASAGSYLSSVDIIKVDANCLIYEIPVTLRYDLLRKPSMRLYSTAGLSSYLMKKEKYVYDFLYNSYPYQGKYNYTGNKSLFAVLSLSVGIERNISSRFSLLAEPIVNIPMGGVGEGKVKLYSTGLQLGVKYNFRKK